MLEIDLELMFTNISFPFIKDTSFQIQLSNVQNDTLYPYFGYFYFF